MDPKFLSFLSGISLVVLGIAGTAVGALVPGAQPLLVASIAAIPTGVGIIAASNSGPSEKR